MTPISPYRAPQSSAQPPILRETDGWGLYIHIPFCARKCPYCDFTVAVLKDRPERAYIDALLCELDARKLAMRGPLRTIYIGGGTPGLLRPESVAYLGEGLRQRRMLGALEEFTVEVNPEHTDIPRLDAWKQAGANRISMGAQALHPEALRILGREHTPDQVISAIERAHQRGFEHISIDFIFAVPGVDRQQTLHDLTRAIALAHIDHVSLYELTVEPRTVFGMRRKRGELPPWPDDDVIEHWHALVKILEGGGFARYEVSNFAKEGGRARHNASYWVGRPYLGIGVSAASLLWTPDPVSGRPTPIQRRTNRAQLKGYLHDPLSHAFEENITWQEHLGELLSLALRTVRPLDLRALESRFGVALEHVEKHLQRWVQAGRVAQPLGTDRRVYQSTHAGMEIADSISVDLLQALDDDLASARG